MARKHGKDTYVSVDGTDLSTYLSGSEFGLSTDVHDTTGYQPTGDAKTYTEGLLDGTFSMEGWYDTTASVSPRPILTGLRGGGAVTIIRRVEGTGSGLPQDSFSAILTSYSESSPAEDIVTFSAEFQITGPITDTAQS